MRVRHVGTVFRKELKETLRDRRTLLVMLVLPVFLYPLLMIVMEQLAIFGQRQLEERPATVAVAGGGEELLPLLERDSTLRVVEAEGAAGAALQAGRVDAVVDFPAAGSEDEGTRSVRLLYDASRDGSRRARERVDARLREWGDTLLARRLAAEGLPASFARPLAVTDSSVATAQRLGGYALGRFLPVILILMTLLGAFYPAIDLAAGEKERGTLETLLTTPVPAREIVAGKFLAVTVLALTTAALNLGSMLLTFQSGVFQAVRQAGMQFSIPLHTVAMVLVLMVPLAVLFSSLFLGIAVRAHSFKEAQNALMPVQFASLIPAYLPAIPGIGFTYGIALIPIGGLGVLFRELMGGGAPLGPALAALGSSVVYAALALRFAARAFGREEVLFGTAGGAAPQPLWAQLAGWRRSARGVPLPAESLAFVAGIALLYFYVGVRLQLAQMERGLLASQWLLLGLPAVLFAALGPYRVREALALRPVSPRALLAALLIILGGIPVGWLLGWLQGLYLRVPEKFLSGMEELLSAHDPGRFLWLLLLVALTPAVCEELVFRGVLLQGLARELPMTRAVLASAAIFGAFHLSFETVIRFLPTAFLGVLLGYVVWHTRSIFPSMLMHFLNNAVILALVAASDLQAYVTGPTGQPRWIAVGAGVALLAAGLRLLPKRPSAPLDAPGPPPREPHSVPQP